MNIIISDELKLFLVFCVAGVLIGLFFDIFRIIRKSFKVSDMHTYIEDIIFGLITGIFLIFLIFIYNNRQYKMVYVYGVVFRYDYLFVNHKQILYKS